jgi:cytochrome P450
MGEGIWYAVRCYRCSLIDANIYPGRLLGSIFQYRVYTETIIVLNTAKAALDLLDHRSGIYSDRRPSPMIDLELRGIRKSRHYSVFTMSSSDPAFKEVRKMMNSGMNTRAVKKYEPIQDFQTVTLLDNLVKNPENFISHLRR